MRKENFRACEREMRGRVSSFSKHLETVDWRLLWKLCSVKSEELGGLCALIQGTKPAYIPDSPITTAELLELVPPDLDQVVLTKNGWIIDLSLIRKVLCRYKEQFADFNFELLDCNEIVAGYIEARTVSMSGIEKGEKEKTGLLLGFPFDSVVGDDRRVAFEGYGFMFRASLADSVSFGKYLQDAYQSSGMELAVIKLSERAENGFATFVLEDEGGISELEIDGDHFLEVISVNKAEVTVKRQLLFLKEGVVTQQDVVTLLNTFANRYDFPSVQRTSSSLGLSHDYFVEALSDLLANELPYLILTETKDAYSLQPAKVDREALRGYLANNRR